MIVAFKDLFRLFIATFFCSMLLVSCNETIDTREMKNINGLIYKLHATEPFSGTVINYKQYADYSKAEHWNCEIHFSKGELQGPFTCVSIETGIKSNVKAYDHNSKIGQETIWNSGGVLIRKIDWDGGRRNGLEEIYHPVTGRLLEQIHWLNDQKDGEEKKWDLRKDILLYHMIWVNGKNSGFSKSESEESNYRDGKLHGYFKRYHIEISDEVLAIRDEQKWAHGGASSFISAPGSRLIWEENYDNGVKIWSSLSEETSSQNAHSQDASTQSMEPGTDYD